MRPTRFESLLVDAAKGLPGVQQVATLAEAGHTAHPLGVVLQLESGAQVWWQITAVSTPGDVYGVQEREPVTGPAPAPVAMPDLSVRPLRTAALEHALAAGIVAAGSEEVAAVEAFSDRTTPHAIEYGVAVRFHSGATIFVNGLAYVRAGETRPPRDFLRLPDEL